MRTERNGALLVALPIIFGTMSFALPAHSTQLGVFENVTDDIGRGFGSSYNRYSWSMAGLNDDVYVGTWNAQLDLPEIGLGILSGSISLDGLGGGDILNQTGSFLDSQGGEIWRLRTNTGEWSQVFDAPSDSEIGYRKMVEHNGALFAGSVDYENGGRILTSTDGATWSELSGGPSNNANNKSVRAMHSHMGKLYVGTENDSDGAELWSWDGADWEMVQQFTDGSVAEINTHNGELYVGTWNFDGLTDGKFALYNSDNGSDFTDITPVFPGSDTLANVGVMQIQELDGELVLTTVNYRDGFTMLRSNDANDPNAWKVVTVDGLGDPDNKYGWSSTVIDDTMYLGTFNAGIEGGALAPLPVPLDGRGQLYQSTDGIHWEVVVDDGFGSPFNYGIRTLSHIDDKLYAGTASNLLVFDPFAYDWADFIDRNDTFFDANADLRDMLTTMDFDNIMALLADVNPDIIDLISAFDFSSPFIGTQVWAADVPEPGILALFSLALVGFSAARFRKNAM